MTNPRMRAVSLAALIVLVALHAACAVIPLRTAANEPRCRMHECVEAAPTRATTAVDGLPRDVFVGIAMSGGGLRAANFSAEVLFQLQELGFLDHAAAISSVSGSSLTAAYYGLFGRDATRWNPERVEAILRRDLQVHWVAWWFNPYFVPQYWLTHFDRSDIMKNVFDFYVFNDGLGRRKTFADMGTGLPRILMNATSLPHVGAFVFSDERLAALGSRLDRYPVSHAVMASGAFPGAFHNVTLRDFTPKVKDAGRPPTSRVQRYEHLFDGGPSDNLGVDTLLQLVEAAKPDFCFLFVVDAYPRIVDRGRHDGDTRGVLDFVVDRNVMDSADVFLTLRRTLTLRNLGYPRTRVPGEMPQWDHVWEPGRSCRVWHLTFQRFRAPGVALGHATEQAQVSKSLKLVVDRVDQIPTAWRLSGPGGMSAEEVQGILRGAARLLVREDRGALVDACRWFRARGRAVSEKCPAA